MKFLGSSGKTTSVLPTTIRVVDSKGRKIVSKEQTFVLIDDCKKSEKPLFVSFFDLFYFLQFHFETTVL